MINKYMVSYAYESLDGSYKLARQVYEIAGNITENTFKDLDELLKNEFDTSVMIVAITKLDEFYFEES